LSEEESQTGTLGTLKGVRPVWGRLSRNLHSKESKARLFQSIAFDLKNYTGSLVFIEPRIGIELAEGFNHAPYRQPVKFLETSKELRLNQILRHAQHDAFAQRILSGKILFRRRLIDDRDRLGSRCILRRKTTPGDRRRTERGRQISINDMITN